MESQRTSLEEDVAGGNGPGSGSRRPVEKRGPSAGRATFRPFPDMVPGFREVRLNPKAAGPVRRGGQIVTLLCQLAAPITLN